MEWPPYLSVGSRNGKLAIAGPMGMVVDAITESLNMTSRRSLHRLPNGSWTGAVGNVQRREVDMTMAPMIQSYSRMQVGQYGVPIMYVQFGILSGSGVGTSNVFGYILTFDWKVWALILSAIPILALLMALSNWVRSKMTPKQLAHEMHDNGWELFRNLLYESSPKDRSQMSSRIVLTAWFMAVLVIANSFAGHLKSSMAIKNEPAQVDSVRDVAYAKGRLRPIVWKGSHCEAFLSTSRSPELSRVWQMVSQRNGSQIGKDMFRDEHMIQVLHRQAVLMVDHNSLQWRMAAFCSRNHVQGFHFAREHIDENPLSFLISRAMPRALHRKIYVRITWLYGSGLVNKWMTDSLGDWQRCVRQGGGHSANDLTLKDTQASFVLWAMVLGLALVAFVAEMLVGSSSAKHPPVARPLPQKLPRRRMGMTHLRTAYGILKRH
ncbi:glutamate receptor ionotropic, delta-1-like [Ixodes scapularis]|uniref:glutamate receptor ionotropic, delta-1-like n=1 Tax=Ixodes scapularis TaxID=6945 RepID=UPI001C38DB2A|nr:glutamate receptor ionotropic, delta-1-like [Ixodes scapularis]